MKKVVDKTNIYHILVIRALGNFIFIVSVLGLIFTFWPLMTSEVGYRIHLFKGEIWVAAGDGNESFGTLLEGKKNVKVLSPVDINFGLIVEKIGANAPVIANVDAGSKKDYDNALKKGVAHAKGTVFPGMRGVSYLFAHSTGNFWDVQRYNAVFYLLRNLEPGDRIVTYFGGRRFDYIVREKKVTPPSDVSHFTLKTNEPLLVLQTCDPPGSSINRLLVIAKLEGQPTN